MTRVLAADVGGTKTLLAIMEKEGQSFEIVQQKRFESGKYPGLLPILTEFLGADGATGKDAVAAACFAVAGPVVNGVSETSNLPWIIRAAEIAEHIGVRTVQLINDFAAIGWGIPHLGPADLATLQVGKAVPEAPVGYIGAGTGCGEGFMTWNAAVDHYQVHASEGGHADFAPRDEVEYAIHAYLARRHGRVSWERLISGMGIHNIYRALVEELGRPESPAVRADMEAEDPAAVVSKHAATDSTCSEALDRFVGIYGAEAGNMALRLLAHGGIYVAGGIAPRLIDRMKSGAFIRAFNDKGRFSATNAQIPVHVILNTQVGLVGAAACASRALPR